MSKSSVPVLAKVISSKKGLTQAEAERFITRMFEVANEGLQDDKLLKMKWLGSFKVTAVKDRESVDVNTGERILIEGRDKISFTPDNILKEIVNKPFAQFETVVVNDGVDFSDIDEKFAKAEFNEDVIEPEDEEITEEEAPEEIPQKEALVESPAELPQEESSADTAKEENKETTTGVFTFGNDLPEEENAQVASDEVIVISDSIEQPEPETHLFEKQEPEPELHEKPKAEPDLELEPEPQLQPEQEKEETPRQHHFVIPKYVVVIAAVVFIALIGGIGWIAFSYGQMQAQRDSLATQLSVMKKKQTAVAKPKPTPAAKPAAEEDSVQMALKQKAKEDSIRMEASSKAVMMAEKAEAENDAEGKIKKNANDKPVAAKDAEKDQQSAAKYDADPRIRTGGYRIAGVAQTITVKSGQTMSSLSKRYLGPGMECYIEAMNGCKEVKTGQKLKIPKLELKKKKQ